MCVIMKGGFLKAYSSAPRVTHGVLATWISLKCGLKASLKVRDRLLFISYSCFGFLVGLLCIFF